jgi:hypothetical protein
MSVLSKERVVALLEERRLEELADMLAMRKGALRFLNRLLFERDTLLRWRAVEAMGALADRLAGEDPEAVRVILRTLLWTINEESGGIGWSAPECIGEIVYRRPAMFGEFAPVIIAQAEEEMLRRGVLWAAGRIAQSGPDLVREAAGDLAAYLEDPDPVVRGYAVRFLHMIGERPDARHRHLLEDSAKVPLYEEGRLYETRVADLAGAWFNPPKKVY